MDPNMSDILSRANRRKEILNTLDTSIMSEKPVEHEISISELENAPPVITNVLNSPNEPGTASFVDANTPKSVLESETVSPLKATFLKSPSESETASPLKASTPKSPQKKSRFSHLAESVEEFQYQMKPPKTTKEIFNKARNRFETSKEPMHSASGKYVSPFITRKEGAITTVRSYNEPPSHPHVYSKKPADGEVDASCLSFTKSKNYWRQREIENPSLDMLETAANMAKPKKRDFTTGKKFPVTHRTDAISPVPKVSRVSFSDEQASALNQLDAAFEDEPASSTHSHQSSAITLNRTQVSSNPSIPSSGDDDSSCLMSWNKKYGIKSVVVTEDDVRENDSEKEDEVFEPTSNQSLSVPSDSFDFQRPSTPGDPNVKSGGLLDDINTDFSKVHTPVSRPATHDFTMSEGTRRTLLHSLSVYRKNEHTPTISRQKDPIDDLSHSPVAVVMNSMHRRLTPQQRDLRIKELENIEVLCASHIEQHKAALRYVRSKTKFSIEQEVEALRSLTVVYEKRRAAYMEANTLKETMDVDYLYPRARVRFDHISVSLRRDLDAAPNNFVYLFVMIRHRGDVVATNAVFVNDILAQGIGCVEFKDILEFNDVSPDFSLSVEVFGVTVTRKDNYSDKKSFSIKRMMTNANTDRAPVNMPPEQFSLIGRLLLSYEDVKRRDHECTVIEYPIDKHMKISTSFIPSDPDDSNWVGMVSIYRVVDGKGAWELSHGRIGSGRFKLWRFPEDAESKPPILSLNIRDMSEPARAITGDVLGFQYDFEFKMFDANDKVIRIMLSMSEESERAAILKVLGQAYKFYNTWRWI